MSFLTKLTRTKSATRTLETMLTTRRPARTKSEARFVREYIDTIRGIQADGYGNRFIKIGQSRVLWSAHTDSVHKQGGTQSTVRRGDFVALATHERQSSCLGADCATGVWLMREMIARKIPGLYVFHRDEEIGGIGSNWIASDNRGFLAGVEIAIAFDRKGFNSIITHQGGRTASDQFAASLAPMLPGKYSADAGGIFTDTANYAGVVPECSNISVGYENAHSEKESQNVSFAARLLDALCEIDQSRLVVSRRPGERDYFGARRYTDFYSDVWDDYVPNDYVPNDFVPDARGACNYDRLLRLLKSNPEAVADFLDRAGIDADDMRDRF